MITIITSTRVASISVSTYLRAIVCSITTPYAAAEYPGRAREMTRKAHCKFLA